MKINPPPWNLGNTKLISLTNDINDVHIPRVVVVKDLGISYDENLKFNDYISDITRCAYQRLEIIFWGFVSRSPSLMKLAFVTYVRPIPEYVTCVWSPYLIKDIRKLEYVQRYFTRLLFPKQYSYNEREMLLLESLESRRLKNDIKKNGTDLDPTKLFLFPHNANNNNSNNITHHCLKLRKRLFHSNQTSNSFCNQAVDCCHSLLEELVTEVVCSLLLRYQQTRFVEKYIREM